MECSERRLESGGSGGANSRRQGLLHCSENFVLSLYYVSAYFRVPGTRLEKTVALGIAEV